MAMLFDDDTKVLLGRVATRQLSAGARPIRDTHGRLPGTVARDTAQTSVAIARLG